MTKCTFCGARDGQPHDRSVEHGDVYRRTFVGDVAQCGCRWSRGPITLPDGSRVGFGDVLHECPIHKAATQARPGRPGQSGSLFTVNTRSTR
jgi:hypothetical protein